MRTVFLITFLLLPGLHRAQVYIGSATEISFFSKSTVEDISASNKNAKPVWNSANGDLIVKIPNTGFQFRSALMQEHFNENYMESHKYPFSTFEGKINDTIDVSREGKYPVTATGTLSIHGVSKSITASGTVTVMANSINLFSEFRILMTDYNIQVPGIQVNTMEDSDEVQITVQSVLVPYSK